MFKVFIILLLLVPLSTQATEPAIPFSHELLDRTLVKFVNGKGMVDYAGLKKDRSALDAYIDSIRQVSPKQNPLRFPNRDSELAYWINAYNAYVLKGVIDAYPVESVKDIKILNGFFNRMDIVLGSKTLTLNYLENEIIRPEYRDPRVHFVVNCGAWSCPELENHAFTGNDLNERLESALTRFAHSQKHVRLEGKTLYLSKILSWYGDDFSNWYPADRPNPSEHPALINYLMPYLPAATAQHIKESPQIDIDFFDYNWALNQQETTPK